MAIVNTGKAAKTDFVRLARFDSADLLRAHLHTGRTHQIRVHPRRSGIPCWEMTPTVEEAVGGWSPFRQSVISSTPHG
jgi:hypothetical protein